ncbi:hypothetical protein SAMN04487906_0748 [Zhouia amylolytica]|uniref:Four helix bundle sensory module for signal transduction n=1 Tax=Zhouia amylolytica TaxID=376730 RepID=A0A1I6QN85_9FLAO|nr:hypothetical protein [Zhouia amylolytica]MCQ0111986.1 hypothetical protein [Zhouia amylolytica]SFS53925.1 hypothetical protein SAMN04487906_0748 [Zhouia amylolytica]
MRINYYLSILIMLSFYVSMAQSNSDTLIIKSDYAKSYNQPILATKGTIIINQIDSLHLVNNIRLKHYEEIRSVLGDSLDLKLNTILLRYENVIRENDSEYNKLLESYNKLALINKEYIKRTDTSLQVTAAHLDTLNTSLVKTDKHLTKTKKMLKKNKRSQTWQKLGIGFGGVALGILLGIFLN